MKIAVVRNRDNPGIIQHFGPATLERYGRSTVQSVMDALRAAGHEVRVFEGDMDLLPSLGNWMPPDADTGRPGGMVFNMAYGIQGSGRYTHVPAMLEMGGVPYTGSDPRGHAAALDKVVAKLVGEFVGVRTPRFATMEHPDEPIPDLRYPLVVKPRHESTSYGVVLVHERAGLEAAVAGIVREFEQEALVEEYIDGREIAVSLLGNDPVEVLPLTELDFGDRALRMMTKPDKFHRTIHEPVKRCPASLPREAAEQLKRVGLDVFRACRIRDYARVDVRLHPDGTPYMLEINSMASLGAGGCFVASALAVGYGFDALVARIVDVAHIRYFGEPAPRGPKGVGPGGKTSAPMIGSGGAGGASR